MDTMLAPNNQEGFENIKFLRFSAAYELRQGQMYND